MGLKYSKKPKYDPKKCGNDPKNDPINQANDPKDMILTL